MLFYGSDVMHRGLHKKSKGYFLNKQPEFILDTMVSSSWGLVVGLFGAYCVVFGGKADFVS